MDNTTKQTKAAARYLAGAIGPRVVGGVYRCGYWHVEYVVLAVTPRRDDWMSWSVTEQDLTGPYAGRIREHCTPWDAKRDAVVSLPE
jgi:hypothetical protein